MHLRKATLNELWVNLHEPLQVTGLAGIDHSINIPIKVCQLALRLHRPEIIDLVVADRISAHHPFVSRSWLGINGITNLRLVLELLPVRGGHHVLHGLRLIQINHLRQIGFKSRVSQLLATRTRRGRVLHFLYELFLHQLVAELRPNISRHRLGTSTVVQLSNSSTYTSQHFLLRQQSEIIHEWPIS